MKWKSPQPRLPKEIRKKIKKLLNWLFGSLIPSQQI